MNFDFIKYIVLLLSILFTPNVLLSKKIQYNPTQSVYPIYYADIFYENGTLLHFKWRPDFADYEKVLITDLNMNVIDSVFFPDNKILLPNKYNKVNVIAVDKKGLHSKAVLVDVDKFNKVKTQTLEPLVVKSNESGKAGFYTLKSDKEIILNGVNYCGLVLGDHNSFEPFAKDKNGVLCYDRYNIETMFRLMNEYKYNAVRVFIKTGYRSPKTYGLSGPSNTKGIWKPYMDNFIDFVNLAQKHGIYVFPCFAANEMPSNDYFKNKLGGIIYKGQDVLFSELAIKAKQEYIELFLNYIKQSSPKTLNGIGGIEMQNEIFFDARKLPFKMQNGIYKLYDGTSYDMSDDNQRRALARRTISLYYSAMKKTVKKIVPTLPVGESVFCLGAANKNPDQAYPIRISSKVKHPIFPIEVQELLNTDLDFVDLHVYRWKQNGKGTGSDIMRRAIKNMLVDTPTSLNKLKNKVLILGEFGAQKDRGDDTIDKALDFVSEVKREALEFGFKGTFYWTIDSFEQKNLWNMMYDDAKILKEM